MHPSCSEEMVYDIVGIGFEPSNLALAVCADELAPELTYRFLERADQVHWHPGTLFEDARMQISFLKDLVTLRDPGSRFSFLQYLQARGRLELFVNLDETRPSRLEYQDYLRWVAGHFADRVRYRSDVRRVVPEPGGDNGSMTRFRIEVDDVASGRRWCVRARNVVHAAGGVPVIPDGIADGSPRVFHSSSFLHRIPTSFPDRDGRHRFCVVGGGQSAGEIVDHLLDRYDRCDVHLVLSGYAPRPTDNSPFVNEQFFSRNVDRLFERDAAARAALGRELAGANYGVVRGDLLDRIYEVAYRDEVRGRRRLHVHPSSRVTSAHDEDGAVRVVVQDRFDGAVSELGCDAIVLATGFRRSLDPDVFADVLPSIVRDGAGRPELSRHHRVRTVPPLRAGLYLQGYGESRFGLGDTLLSLLPFRSKEIVADVRARAAPPATSGTSDRAPYPPSPYLEPDADKVYALVERFPFATLVTAPEADAPAVTHLPLVLERSEGSNGVLRGHVDRANPQAARLDGRRVLAVFHGPNAYMPPGVYDNDPLPTWNSMTVHVWGRASVISERDVVVDRLCELASRCEPASRLRPDDERIAELVDGVVAFEVQIDELVGRFKLSQEHDEPNRRRASRALAAASEAGHRDFIASVVGVPLEPDEAPARGVAGAPVP